MGWRNSARHWHRYETAYLLLGGLATPLVVSVHSVVSSDFAIGVVPGWHETVFPPYFVAGAIFSGFAMVLVLCILLRTATTTRSIHHRRPSGRDGQARCWRRACSRLTAICREQFTTYYGGEPIDVHVYWYRLTDFSKYAGIVWTLFACNTLVPQVLWIPRVRRSPVVLFIVSLIVLVGMWLERFMIHRPAA